MLQWNIESDSAGTLFQPFEGEPLPKIPKIQNPIMAVLPLKLVEYFQGF